MTRKKFIGCLFAALALPSVGMPLAIVKKRENDWFEDIRVDRYYDIQGGYMETPVDMVSLDIQWHQNF